MKVEITETNLLTQEEKTYITERLTKPGGEFVRVFADGYAPLPVVLIRESSNDEKILSWAAKEHWQGYEAVEAYTDEDYRRRGLAVTATLILSVVRDELLANEVAVFSPEMVPVAIRAGLVNTTLFEKDDAGEWKPLARVKSVEEPSGGPPSALGVLVGD